MPAPPPGAGAPVSGSAGDAPTDPPAGQGADPAPAQGATGPSVTGPDEPPEAPPAAEPGPGTDLARRPAASPEVWGADGGGVTVPRQGGSPEASSAQGQQSELTDWDDPGRLHGLAPGAATGWGASPASGPGAGPDSATAARSTPDETPQVSWGRDEGSGPADPRQAAAPEGRPQVTPPESRPQVTGPQPPAGALPPGEASGPREEPPSAPTPGAAEPGTMAIRSLPPTTGAGEPGTMAIRLPPAGSLDSPRPESGAPGAPSQPAPPAGQPNAGAAAPASGPPHQAPPAAAPGGAPGGAPGTPPAGEVAHDRTVGLRMPRQSPAGAPAAPPGAGPAGADQRPAWAQQSPEAGAAQPTSPPPGTTPPGSAPPGGGPTPWRPPVSDPFQQAAQAVSHPAGLGRRLIARLVDSVVLLGGTGAVAAVFAGSYLDHIQDKIDAVEKAGVTSTVWLVDGTTWVYLAAVVGTFLLLGLVAEVLPTGAKGRTLGKKLCGLTVLDIEQQEPPGFLAALRRWLVYSVLGALAVGVVNVLWCLFDRPWRQCWHDKVARTFVTRDSREVSL